MLHGRHRPLEHRNPASAEVPLYAGFEISHSPEATPDTQQLTEDLRSQAVIQNEGFQIRALLTRAAELGDRESAQHLSKWYGLNP